jgi:hypothetical protein
VPTSVHDDEKRRESDETVDVVYYGCCYLESVREIWISEEATSTDSSKIDRRTVNLSIDRGYKNISELDKYESDNRCYDSINTFFARFRISSSSNYGEESHKCHRKESKRCKNSYEIDNRKNDSFVKIYSRGSATDTHVFIIECVDKHIRDLHEHDSQGCVDYSIFYFFRVLLSFRSEKEHENSDYDKDKCKDGKEIFCVTSYGYEEVSCTFFSDLCRVISTTKNFIIEFVCEIREFFVSLGVIIAFFCLSFDIFII